MLNMATREAEAELKRLQEQKYMDKLCTVYDKPYLGYHLYFLERERVEQEPICRMERRTHWASLPGEEKALWYQRSIQLGCFLHRNR